MHLLRILLATIAFLGDSNLWLGGEDCSDPVSWSHWMVESMKQSATSADSVKVIARSFARSGATLTNAATTPVDTAFYSELLADANTLYNQALRLNGVVGRHEMESPGMIVLYGGSNDAWFSDRRPGLFDTVPTSRLAEISEATPPGESTTLRESLLLLIRLLQSVNPDSRIIMVGPPFMTKAPPGRVSKVADIMEETSRREGLQMIRLDTISLIDPAVESKKFTHTRDGVHTSPSGARRIGDYIYNQITP